MSSLIKKPHELKVQTTIKALIYGQAGMGKTTLALSSAKPLLLDFDNGVNRVNYLHQCPTVQITKFEEANEVLNEDLSEFDTIIVDTIGKMMDYIIIKCCGLNTPKIQDWSRINQEFTSFVRKATSLNKHVIFTAHRDVRKEGEENVFIPSVREKTYSAIVSELDLLGYLEMKGNDRILTFNPTNRNDGKNTCNLPPLMKITTVVDKNGVGIANNYFETQVINQFVANMQARIDASTQYTTLVTAQKELIQSITTLEQIESYIKGVDAIEHIGNSRLVLAKEVHAKATELGFVYNKDSKKYEAKA